jgi:hypothetical protein
MPMAACPYSSRFFGGIAPDREITVNPSCAARIGTLLANCFSA